MEKKFGLTPKIVGTKKDYIEVLEVLLDNLRADRVQIINGNAIPRDACTTVISFVVLDNEAVDKKTRAAGARDREAANEDKSKE